MCSNYPRFELLNSRRVAEAPPKADWRTRLSRTDTPTNLSPAASASPALYAVMVGHAESPTKDRWLGSWTGLADTEAEAHTKARADVWQARFDAEGLSPVFATRVLPRFVVAEHWGHIFLGNREEMTRWAYDRVAEKLVTAEVQTNGKWSRLADAAVKDLTESIHDNDATGTPGDFELAEVDALSGWAAEAPDAPGARKATP